MVSAIALLLDPNVSSTVSVSGEARVRSDVVPMVDVRYFITHDISVEIMWGYSDHKLRALGIAMGDISLGATKILPFFLTARYNPRANNQISPYVGVGLNHTLFAGGFPGDAQEVKYDDGFGTVFDFGVDYFLGDRWFFNSDVKKILNLPYVRVVAGIAEIAHAAVDLGPRLVSFSFD